MSTQAPAESEAASGESRGVGVGGGGGQKDRRDWSRFGGSVQEWASGGAGRGGLALCGRGRLCVYF